jgi:hypothetical protein
MMSETSSLVSLLRISLLAHNTAHCFGQTKSFLLMMSETTSLVYLLHVSLLAHNIAHCFGQIKSLVLMKQPDGLVSLLHVFTFGSQICALNHTRSPSMHSR